MTDDSIYDGLRDKLNESDWPSVYMFKFIAPNDKEKEIVFIFKDFEYTSKPSRTGKYISITSKVMINSPEEIIQIYKQASMIKGVIAL
jgi:hypothetical protein